MPYAAFTTDRNKTSAKPSAGSLLLEGLKYLSSVCIIMSTMPYAVCTLDTPYVSFGFSMAKIGRIKSLAKPLLICFSSS